MNRRNAVWVLLSLIVGGLALMFWQTTLTPEEVSPVQQQLFDRLDTIVSGSFGALIALITPWARESNEA